MNNYNEIRSNLINNFFNKNYRYTCVTCKNSVISDIRQRLPFDVKYNGNVLNVNVGDGIKLDFKLTWETKNFKNSVTKEPSEYYRLISIE